MLLNYDSLMGDLFKTNSINLFKTNSINLFQDSKSEMFIVSSVFLAYSFYQLIKETK